MATKPRTSRPKRTPDAGRRRAPAIGAEPGGVDGLARLEAAIAALRADIAALQSRAAPSPVAPPIAAGDLGALAAQLRASAQLLVDSLAEVPRAQDFQPLADHLYAFAESTPRLIEGLESVRQAVVPIEAAARSLGEVAETLLATQQSWSESLLRLPRAEDYEPLAAPLREFARVSPALAETLGSVVRSVGPLPELVGRLSETADRLRMSRPAAAARHSLAPALAETADSLAAARGAIRGALDSLPRDQAYARFAAQLKELAGVSPSLMEWLRSVPALSLPLGEAIARLDQAAQDLEEAERAARQALAAAES